MEIQDLLITLPMLLVMSWGLVLLLIDLWIPKNRKGITALLAAAGLVAALVINLLRGWSTASAFSGMTVVDGFATFLNGVFLVSGLFGIAIAYDYLKRMNIERGEYYPLLMFSISGMMLMTCANDLIMIFLALELLSIPLYVLSGFALPKLESEEAALKYFLLGAFSSGFILYGIAMIYGATMHTNLQLVVANAGNNPTLFLVGAALLLVGFGFKVAAAPFHMWLPDVYQGAPTPVTGFMAVATKAAGFAALLRVFLVAFSHPAVTEALTPILWGLAVLTMLAGNVLALVQNNTKRLLAYSSIANAGYLLVAFVPYGAAGMQTESAAAMLFFLAVYGITTLGAWAVVIAMERADGGGLELSDFAGLGKKRPWLAAAMTVFMLSFIGMPLTLGFWGKFLLFRTAVEGGQIALAVVGLLTSLLSAYYYLRVVVVMYMKPGEPQVRSNVWINAVVAVAALAVLALSFSPGFLLDLASRAALSFLP
jgi:NADH-quinone oxidoreductase subunit N